MAGTDRRPLVDLDPFELGRRIAAAPSFRAAMRLVSDHRRRLVSRRHAQAGVIQEPVRSMAPPEVLSAVERLEVLAQVERETDATVKTINRQPEAPMAGITGASVLAQNVRERVAAAKHRISRTHDRLTGALDELDASADNVEIVAKAIEQEAAELTSAAAQLTNGPPA